MRLGLLFLGNRHFNRAATLESRPSRNQRAIVCRRLGAFGAVAGAMSVLPGLAGASVPHASQYDALLVSASNSRTILLGTNIGLLRSTDGGHSWNAAGFAGRDVLNLVRAGATIFVAGNGLLDASSNGGRKWHNLRPKGLPDLHFRDLAADPSNDRVLYATLDTGGLYRSIDSGTSFQLVSVAVGPAIDALAATPTDLLAGDTSNGIYLSTNGRQWRRTANGMVMGLAVSPSDTRDVLAASWGISSSSNGGRHWTTVLKSKVMFGSVAWAPNKPRLAYAVGYYDGTLWRSNDLGKTWTRVALARVA